MVRIVYVYVFFFIIVIVPILRLTSSICVGFANPVLLDDLFRSNWGGRNGTSDDRHEMSLNINLAIVSPENPVPCGVAR